MRSIHSLIVSLALAMTPAPAWASEPMPTAKANPSPEDLTRADDLFENGRALYQDGSYDGAIAAFKSAYELSGDPVLLYNIALAYDRMDSFDEAIEYLEAYRAVAPAEERDALSEKVDSLRRRKLKAQTDAAAKAPPPKPVVTETPVDNVPDKPEPKKDRVFGPAAITLTVITVAAAGIGIGLGVTSSQRKKSAEDRCNKDANGDLFCPDTSSGDIDDARSLAIGADVSFAIAGAAGIALIAVVAAKAAKKNKRKREGNGTAATLVPSRGGAGLSLRF